MSSCPTPKSGKLGPYFFISETQGYYEKGQKLVMVVMIPRKHLGISPASSPAGEVDGPAVAPSSAATSSQSGVLTLVASGVFHCRSSSCPWTCRLRGCCRRK
ncbi:hypothetical protein PS1_027682 [Malus domestica]